MKLGVSMWSVVNEFQKGNMDVAKFIDLMHEQGVDGVELLDFFWKDKEKELPMAVQKLKNYNMEIACYSIGNDFVLPDEEAREKQIQYVKQGIDDAVRVGSYKLRVFSGSPKEGVSYEDGKRWIIECFKECVKYAEKKGVVLALENHGLFAGKSQQVKEIIEVVGSKYLRSTADTGNFFLVGEKPDEAVDNIKEYIVHVHFKDFKRSEPGKGYKGLGDVYYVGCVLGQGDVEMKRIVDIIQSAGYNSYLAIEFEGADPQIQGTVESINFVKKLLGG
ncbi:Sugar phosphate isomerase/epimerase [Caldanaerobius fijiensis DSM 17918]|uniref:Sugar phosphate isomerase/epimerase n=1 Tax=Caldanaerobius fijiensis DSM 17918 TaxID=1121256 RepID=A0A1M4TPZ8_9THEO|nr:sugar phosphate isomerase/epimerase family protein [Caldanaerobius fijiensis]SHE46466.1 Sugar phosphate isomerase/epimerase [Caldanaerobius fijiensis DSM 17918]